MKNPLNKLSIEHNGYKLTPSENLRARFGRFAMLHQGLKEGKAVDVIDDHSNPVVQRFAAEAGERQRRRSSDVSTDDLTTLEMVKAGAYELGTLAVPRQMGMLAVRAATRFGLDKLASKEGKAANVLSAVHEYTDVRLKEAEEGLHNPTFRKKSGYNLAELRERRRAA